MKRLIACALLCALPLLAQAETGFEQLARITGMPDELQGDFRQQKYLAGIDASLNSSGRFSYRRGVSIRWQILEPIENEILLTPAGLSSRQGNIELLRLDSARNPNAAILGEILFALLSAQWDRLAQYFDMNAEIEGRQWHARLQPRDGVVGQLFERVELRGAELLQQVVLHEASGDRTTIFLENRLE